jgi:hypothetical protein
MRVHGVVMHEDNFAFSEEHDWKRNLTCGMLLGHKHDFAQIVNFLRR